MKMTDAHGRHRFLEIMPGAISWGIIFLFLLMAIYNPVACAIAVIIFDFFWIIRTVYLTTLLIMAYRKLTRQKNRDWLELCRSLPGKHWEDIYQLVIFPVYKEGLDILIPSLEALNNSSYPKERLIVAMTFEQRNPQSRDNAAVLEKKFASCFGKLITTIHPENIPGERNTKGANATWGAKRAREYIVSKGIAVDKVLVSCFDADTCVDKGYFGCLTYHFLINPRPHQCSYQPIPVYNNNIWYAPSFARLVEISSSFCQMIESMRLEKFVTFSSHSMSFKTLIDINYWPLNMVSDDSVVYWKAYLHYNGEYQVIPLYTTVSMDVAYSNGFIKTLLVQYKQKRRWAWGVENFPFVVSRFAKNSHISLGRKIRRSFHLLESHITWAIWAIIMMVIAPLPILFGGGAFSQMSIGYNLSRITGLLLHFSLLTSLVWILLSRTTLPPRPKDVSWLKNIVMVVEWVIVPLIILVLGSTPAIDAQTRLMLGKYMEFSSTEKKRKMV